MIESFLLFSLPFSILFLNMIYEHNPTKLFDSDSESCDTVSCNNDTDNEEFYDSEECQVGEEEEEEEEYDAYYDAEQYEEEDGDEDEEESDEGEPLFQMICLRILKCQLTWTFIMMLMLSQSLERCKWVAVAVVGIQ